MKSKSRYRYRHRVNQVLDVLITLLIAGFCLGPLYWTLSTSLKPMGTEYLIPPEGWPSEPTLEAYRIILGYPSPADQSKEVSQGLFGSANETTEAPTLHFLRPIRNSLIVASTVAVCSLFICALAAYSIARLRFRWKIQSLLLLYVAGLLPAVMVIAPTFVLMQRLHLLRTLPAMILPNIAYNIPLGTWLLAAYFSELPWELEDAAKVDGYKPFGIFWRVIVPLSAPGLFSAGVFAFLGTWGEFILSSVVTMGVSSVQTVPVAILNLSFEFRYQWTWVSAAIVLSVALMVAIALFFQRWVIQGLTAGSVKY